MRTGTASIEKLSKTLAKAVFCGRVCGQTLIDLALPPVCRLCQIPIPSEHDFCLSCWKSLTISEPTMQAACQRCGRPRPRIAGNDPQVQAEDGKVEVCVQCHKEKLRFESTTALWTYQDRVRDAIVAAKYANQAPLGAALGKQLGKKWVLRNELDLPDIVTYVPSHWRRQSQRGGNGNQTIAAAMTRQILQNSPIKRPISCQCLTKMTRAVQKQAWLDNKGRQENVRGAFDLKKSYPWTYSLADKHILLVDDVLTTGATANEVTRVLLDAGAKRVTLAVVARAIRS